MTMEQKTEEQEKHARYKAEQRAERAHSQIEKYGVETARADDAMHDATAETKQVSGYHTTGLLRADGAQALWLFLLLLVTAVFDLLISGALMAQVSAAAGMWPWMGWTLPFGVVVVEALYSVTLRHWQMTWVVNRWRLIPAWILAVLLCVAIAISSILMSDVFENFDQVQIAMAIVLPVVSIAFHLLIFFVPGADVVDATRHMGARYVIGQAKAAEKKATSRNGELLEDGAAAREEYFVSARAVAPATSEELLERLSEVTQRMCARIDKLGTNW